MNYFKFILNKEYMSDIIKNIGNIKQFAKEELVNGISVLGIGYFGSCISVLSNMPESNLDILLPDNLYAPPYSPGNNPPTGMLKYFFSLESSFPHYMKSGLNFLDEYTLFYGGISAYIFSSYRFAMKYIFKSIDTKNALIDFLSFYILPIIITYFVLFPFGIPIISGLMSIIPCIYQEKIGINAFLISIAFISNWFDGELLRNLFDIKLFPMSLVFWIANGWLGIAVSLFLLVIIAMCCYTSWGYLVSFWFLLPIYLKVTLVLTFTELGNTISTEIKNHLFGLVTLFLIYTMFSAYKFLNSKVALGISIGSISVLLIILHSMFKASFELGFFHGLGQIFSSLNFGPILFWFLIVIVVIQRYRTTQQSLS